MVTVTFDSGAVATGPAAQMLEFVCLVLLAHRVGRPVTMPADPNPMPRIHLLWSRRR